MNRLKLFAKKIIPPKFLKLLVFAKKPFKGIKAVYSIFLIKTAHKRHEKALKIVRKKEKIKVAFFLIHNSVWKYDDVFKLMLASNCFDPVVVICPYMVYGHDVMKETMDRAEEFVKSKGYPYVCTYDESADTWLDVKKVLKPDLVFFTNPNKLTHTNYCIDNYLDVLTCYTSYSFTITHDLKYSYNLDFHNLIWKYFIETDHHYTDAKNTMRNEAENTVVTGYAGLDVYFNSNHSFSSPWKSNDAKRKKIIWAPHHTIPNFGANLDYSTFLDYYSFMLDVASRYKDQAIFSFKPHPILRSKLNLPEVWGKERTDKYFDLWENGENTQLNEAEYTDLFMSSDALIHDSGSFMVEYLVTLKPSLFLFKDSKIVERLNGFGKMALKQHYKAYSKPDIIQFVKNVIDKNDYMLESRKTFVINNILQFHNQRGSQNIYKNLENSLK